MNKLVRFTVILSLIVSSLCVPVSAAPAARVPAGWLNGAVSFERAVQLQKELNVPLVVYFYVDWCPYCHSLEREYFPSAPVRDYLSSVIKIKINPESTRADYELGNAFGIGGYPSFFVIPPGSFPVQVSPFRRSGRNLTPSEFAQRCRDVATPRATSVAPPVPAAAAPQASASAPPQAAAVAAPQVSELAPPKFVSTGPTPTVDEVFKRFGRLTGEALESGRVTARLIKGRFSAPELSYVGRFEAYSTESPKSWAVNIVDSVSSARYGFDGKSAWALTDNKIWGAERLPFLAQADLFQDIRLSNRYSRTKLIGKVQEGDREVYLVEATPRTGSPEKLYFDVQNGLLLHREFTRSTKRGAFQFEIYFSNWRNINGLLLPCTMTYLVSNGTMVISVDEIKHNVSIDEAIFQRPANAVDVR